MVLVDNSSSNDVNDWNCMQDHIFSFRLSRLWGSYYNYGAST